jgi:hypothetical protein
MFECVFANKVGPVMPPRDKALVSKREVAGLSVKWVLTPAGKRLHVAFNGQIYYVDELIVKDDDCFHSIRIDRTGQLVKTTSKTYP